MTDDPDGDRIVIDLTSPYEMEWMARGHMSHRYNEAVKERLVEDDGYAADQLEDFNLNSVSAYPTTLSRADWDSIWQKDDEPAGAVFDYIGEEQLLNAVEDYIEKR